MNLIESNEAFCCIFLYPAMQKETNMAVASRMTCKIGSIWRYMETLYCRPMTEGSMGQIGVFEILNKMVIFFYLSQYFSKYSGLFVF